MHRPRVLTRSWTHLALLAALAFIASIVFAPHAVANVELSRISPADGELMTKWPEEITLTFSDPLDPETTEVRLLDPDGEEIPDVTTTIDDDTVSLVPPEDLGHATYSVVWEIPSDEDDEPIHGYTSFTIGTASDGAVVTVPSTTDAPGGPPQWLQTLARGLSLLGMTALVAVWPIWTIVIRPAATRRRARSLVRQALRFTGVAVALLIAGSVLDLIVHASGMVGGSLLDQVMEAVGRTRWGYAWTARMTTTILLGVVLGLASWWFPNRGRNLLLSIAAWALSLGLPLTFSLAGHGWNPPVGRATTVGSAFTHGVATALWAGGILVLLGILVPALRSANPGERTGTLARALTRFSAVTIASWAILALTGAYGAWLQVGNRTAFTTTDYGRAAIVKIVAVGLTLPALVITLLLIRPRLARGNDRWTRPLTGSLAIQAGLIAVVLATTGQMGTTAPARDVLVDQGNQIGLPVMLGDRPSLFLIAPGATGVNHLRLEVPGSHLPNLTVARVHVALPDHPEIGEKDIILSRVSGNNFEHHGTEFSINGTWEMLIGLEEPNMPEITQRLSHTFGTERPEHDVPPVPWRFRTPGGISALILITFGVVAIVAAAYAGRTPFRKEAGSLGVVTLALAVMVVMQGRFDPILAGSGVQSQVDPDDLLMVERGELVYTDYCLSCHGPELRGDGPLAESMDPPPADFAAPHTYVHPDQDMIYWIRNGKQGSAMPGFGDQLSDQEMIDVLAYIKNRQKDLGGE